MTSPNVPAPVPVHHQLRVELFSFEKGCLEAYLESVLDSLKRSHPTFSFPNFKMLSFHKLIEFQSATPQFTIAPAYEFFKLNIVLVQRRQPTPELFFHLQFSEGQWIFSWMQPNHGRVPTSGNLRHCPQPLHPKWSVSYTPSDPAASRKHSGLETIQHKHSDGEFHILHAPVWHLEANRGFKRFPVIPATSES